MEYIRASTFNNSSEGYMQYCKCHCVMTKKQALNAIKDELVEFIQEPSFDEASDVVYAMNRLFGSFVGKPYLRVIPWDKLHIQKISKRMYTYNCIRSTNHLVDGKCPSEVLFKKN